MHSETDENDVQDEKFDEIDDVDELDTDVGEQTVVMSDDSFSDPEISMEINVEKLIEEFDKADANDVHRKAEIRRRLEELVDEGTLEDTYAIDLDDA